MNVVRVSRLAGIPLVVAFTAMLIVRQYYTLRMPTIPQPSIHRVLVVTVNYGKTVYVSRPERVYLYTTYGLCVLFVGLFLGAYVFHQRNRSG